MKNFIGKRWTVDGYYRYSRVKSAWEYERPYREGKVVWEVDGERITCYIDGQIDHSVPYAFSREDTLLIDFSAFIPISTGTPRSTLSRSAATAKSGSTTAAPVPVTVCSGW